MDGCLGCLVIVVALVGGFVHLVRGEFTAAMPWFLGAPIVVALSALGRAANRGRLRARAAELLAARDLGEVPPELACAPPRAGPWPPGYLDQPAYASRMLPLLRSGAVARAIVVAYDSTHDGEGPDVRFAYAWLDQRGRVVLHEGKESYDARHAAGARGQGRMVLDMDAGLELGRVLTVVYDPTNPTEHLVYEALASDEARAWRASG